jgi:hypothetical protein
MATKADFTETQWQTLKFAIEDAIAYVALANGPHFWESMHEFKDAAQYLGNEFKTSASTFVRDLAADAGRSRDKELTADPANIADAALRRIGDAARIVAAVAPDEVEGFNGLVKGVALATANAVDGVEAGETDALARSTRCSLIRAAWRR